MITKLLFVALPLLCFLHTLIVSRETLHAALRNGFVMLGVVFMFALPVGEWQTEYIEDTEPINGTFIYVPSCEHHVEDGGHPTYRTPKYTSLLACCFDEEDIVLQYCAECYTREEAIKLYIAQR